jgi:hypothetical protein
LRAFFFIPLLAYFCDELLLELEESSLLMATFKNLKAHLMMEFNASEQIRAHNRTASIITTFESNSRAPK